MGPTSERQNQLCAHAIQQETTQPQIDPEEFLIKSDDGRPSAALEKVEECTSEPVGPQERHEVISAFEELYQASKESSA